MRRHLQQINHDLAMKWLSEANTGILSVIDSEGKPYQVPLNFVVIENSIFFHCAKVGKKLEAMKKNQNCSFCIIEKDVVLAKQFSTDYGSVTLTGVSNIVDNYELKKKALVELCLKYSKDFMHLAEEEITQGINHCEVVEIKITQISGKVSKNRIHQN